MSKIMLYINAINGGGAERVMVNLAKCFSENGYETILVTSFRDTWEYPLVSTVKRLTLEETELKQSRIVRNFSRIKKLRNLCKIEKPDILISFMREPNFRAIIATRGLPIKTLVSVRNDPNREYTGKSGWIVGKILLPMADGCVFQTEDAQKWFPLKLQHKSRIIYNSVKKEFYQINRTPILGEIVTCGRLVEQKNHLLLIRAFDRVIKEYPEATLKIYGDGILKGNLQTEIIQLGLSDKVFLMGNTNDVVDVLKTADLFVLSSDYEGMPNALMEAMAVGVPCISTDCPCGGPKELFGTELQDQLTECRNIDMLAKTILEVLDKSNKGVVEKMKANAFSPDRVNGEWLEYINTLTVEPSRTCKR